MFLSMLFALAIIGTQPAAAHPHIFIESNIEFRFGPTALEGMTVTWKFDPMFTESILLDFDRNRNRRFEPAEVREIEQDAFSNLRNFGYFLTVTVDGRERRIEKVSDFNARLLQEGLVYSFYVPLDILLRPTDRTVTVGNFDSTYFTDIIWREQNHALIKGDSASHRLRTVPNPKRAYFGGLIVPEELVLTFRRK